MIMIVELDSDLEVNMKTRLCVPIYDLYGYWYNVGFFLFMLTILFFEIN